MTQEAIEAEYWAYHYEKHEGRDEEYDDGDFDEMLNKLESDTLDDDEWETLINDYSTDKD